MATFNDADDSRVPGENLSLFWGFAILLFVLLGTEIVTAGIIPLLSIAFTAIAVWVAHSRLLGGSARPATETNPLGTATYGAEVDFALPRVDLTPTSRAPRRGAVLIMALVALAILAMLGGTLLRWAAMQHRLLKSQEQASQARWLAEAGVERAAAQLTRDGMYTGETWELAAADWPASEAARVRITVTPADGQEGRRIEVDVDYPPEGGVGARTRKELVITDPSGEAL